MKLDARHVVVWNGTGPNRYLGDHLARPVTVHPIEPPRTLCPDGTVARILACVVECGRHGASVTELAASVSLPADLCQRALGRLLRAGTLRRDLVPLSARRTIWRYVAGPVSAAKPPTTSARIYATLTGSGPATAVQLAERLTVDLRKVHQALSSLSRRDLVVWAGVAETADRQRYFRGVKLVIWAAKGTP
jgi:predicted transcriptional regulator